MFKNETNLRSARRYSLLGQKGATSADHTPAAKIVKKPYVAPRLTIYGSLNSNTGTSHRGWKKDHAHGNHKTN